MPADDAMDWRDAVRWWEKRRITYNAVLTALFVALAIRTWPRLRPELGPDKILPLFVLALLANLCYSTAYVIDPLLSASSNARTRHHLRLAVWVAGMFLAILIETYWLLDEIRPPPLTRSSAPATSNTLEACELSCGVAALRRREGLAFHPRRSAMRRP